MNQIMKKFKIFTVFLTLLAAGMFSTAYASDYKYKILDPKYNSTLDNYEYDEDNAVLIEKEPPAQRHPLRKAVLILLLAGVPILGVYRIIRVLKKVDCADDSQDFDFVREVFAVEKLKKVNKKIKNTACYVKEKLDVVKKPVSNELLEKRVQEIRSPRAAEKTHVTNTVQKPTLPKNPPLSRFEAATMDKMKNPVLVNSSKLANNKGLCLVQYKKEFSLIGYIDDNIFLLNKFDSLTSKEIRSRLSETLDNSDRYIVRLGNYKALVEVSDKNMELLLEL